MTAHTIADAFVLTFTEGVSLAEWEQTGLLEREWASLARIAGHYGRFVLVTHGGAGDRAVADRLRPTPDLICNDDGLERSAYAASIPERVAELLDGSTSVLVKSNQMPGGSVAVMVTRALRQRGLHVGLIGRGGYLASRFAVFEDGPDSERAMRVAAEERALCEAADVVVGTTARMVEDLAWRYGLGQDRTACVPNYVAASREPAVERDPAMILYAGQLIERKRVDLLVRAVARLPEQLRAKARLVIVGQGVDEPALRDLAETEHVPAEFHARIPHGDLLGLMARCAVYAQPSALEGHPKTVLEAMAMASAVLVTDAPGLGDVIEHDRTGWLTQPDSTRIARDLEKLLGDRPLRERLGRAAAEHVRQTLSLDRVMEMELAVHRRAMERGRTPSRPAAGPVLWEPTLLRADLDSAVRSWSASLGAYAWRLEPQRRARFLMALDSAVYPQHGTAAIDAEGLHPKHRLMRYHDFFVERIGRGERVVDLGCGVGALACSIAERAGAHVTGMDVSEANLSRAIERAGRDGLADRARFVLGDITTDRIDGRCDVVVLSNVLEHMRDRPALIRQWTRWYGPTRLLIRVPAFDRDWRVPWKKQLGVEWRLDPTHETEYTRDQLEGELGDGGLRVVELIACWGEYWLSAEPV